MTEKLTAYNEANDRQIEWMVRKAMCAYANWFELRKTAQEAACMSEYEAIVRCIDMFVTDDIYAIQRYVIDRAAEKFGLQGGYVI